MQDFYSEYDKTSLEEIKECDHMLSMLVEVQSGWRGDLRVNRRLVHIKPWRLFYLSVVV